MSDDPAKEFQTYLFFLRHFSELIRAGRSAGYGAQLVARILQDQQALIAHHHPNQPSPQELALLRKYLFTAWNSESLARLSSVFGAEVRRFTNQWKPIQCYYATYFQLVAVHFSAAKKTQKSHEPTIRYASNSLIQRMPVPWSLRLDYDDRVLHGFPAGTSMYGPSGWNLSNNEPYFHTANFLRMTGQRKQIDVARDLRRRRKKVPGTKRLYRRADVHIGIVSVFDVLWRFRTWANYHEGDTIIEGGEFQDHAVEFDSRFNELVDTTAALCESILCRSVGPTLMRQLYDDFLALTAAHLDTESVTRRRGLVCP